MGEVRSKYQTFENWLDTVGEEKLSKILRVSTRSIRHWRSGFCDPRVDHMRRIKYMTNGEISYEKMIDRKISTSKFVPPTKR